MVSTAYLVGGRGIQCLISQYEGLKGKESVKSTWDADFQTGQKKKS